MKAIVFEKYGLPEVMELQEVKKPTPKDNEVLIRVQATSINDWDWGLVRGRPYIIRMISGAFFKPKVKIAGTDVAGIVEAIGKNVTDFQLDDEVYGDLSESSFGGFAEYVCTDEKTLILKPAKMSFETAAAMPHAAMLTVQGLIDKGKIQQGQKILINGAGGGVGTFGIQLAKMYGAEVTGVDSTDKLEMLSSMGFDHVIDYRQEDFTKNGQQYDLILDAKTTRSVFSYACSLKPNGTYATVGGSSGKLIQLLILAPFISMFTNKNISLVSLKPNKDLSYINELFQAGKIKAVIDGPYSLEEVPKLLQYFGDGKHQGKIVITL